MNEYKETNITISQIRITKGKKVSKRVTARNAIMIETQEREIFS
jgi:hypothetical protein